MNRPAAPQSETSADQSRCATRIPRTAYARLLLHNLDVDPAFGAVLGEVLPDEEARLAYLNHLAWQARS
ncbi:MAG: hypothetical protein HC889_06190 [Synechococcaceae cyanobacterium SM1_2_3]|nr:hypothetical protein [Synechococcaceae cyanobacterium SM1_2_3]